MLKKIFGGEKLNGLARIFQSEKPDSLGNSPLPPEQEKEKVFSHFSDIPEQDDAVENTENLQEVSDTAVLILSIKMEFFQQFRRFPSPDQFEELLIYASDPEAAPPGWENVVSAAHDLLFQNFISVKKYPQVPGKGVRYPTAEWYGFIKNFTNTWKQSELSEKSE